MNPSRVLPALLIGLLAGCHRSAPDTASGSTSTSSVPVTVSVRLAPATSRKVAQPIHVTGQLQGFQDAMVASDAGGKVVDAPFERGSRVAKGDVLLRIDDRSPTLTLREAEAGIALAEARVALAQGDVERNAPLVKTRAIAEADFRRLEADLAIRKAEHAAQIARRDLARKNLADCTTRAPFSGGVVERFVQTGEYVRPDSRIARIVEISRLRLVLNIPETRAGSIHPGQSVTFQTAPFPGQNFSGVIRFVGGAVRESARDMIVEAEVANPDERLQPGFFAEAQIRAGEQTSVTIPTAALRTEGSRRSVFTIEKGVLLERLVETGESGDGWIEIRRGVAKGERVVVSAEGRPTDGAAARVLQP